MEISKYSGPNFEYKLKISGDMKYAEERKKITRSHI
jgi:hypothetical protein